MRHSIFAILLLVATTALGQTSTRSADDDSHWDPSFRYMGFNDPGPCDFCFQGDTIVAYGPFASAGGYYAPGIAYDDGVSWHPMNTETDWCGQLNSVIPAGRYLYVGGDFLTIGNVSATGLARWDWQSHTWSGVDADFSGRVDAMLLIGDELYVAGSFTLPGGAPASIASYNTTAKSWDSVRVILSGTFGYRIHCLATDGSYLYIGGTFDSVEGEPVPGIARWSIARKRWEPAASFNSNGSPIRDITAIYPWHGSMIVGGDFDSISNVEAHHVARFDGAHWHPFGSLVAPPRHFADLNGQIIESGSETTYDSNWGDFSHWADSSWEGQHWRLSGSSGTPFTKPGALHVHNGQLYAAGSFYIDTSSDHPIAHHMARFQLPDSTWLPEDDISGYGPNAEPNHLIMTGNTLYLSASLPYQPNGPVSTIEALDSGHWSTIDLDSNYLEDPLIFSDSTTLYKITKAAPDSNQSAPSVFAKYDPPGHHWTTLDTIRASDDQCAECYDGIINAAIVRDGILYLGGSFEHVNGIECHDVARFDLRTRRWAPVGSTFELESMTEIEALEFFRGDLYAGGFTDHNSPNLFRYNPSSDSWEGIESSHTVPGISQLVASSTALYAAGDFANFDDCTKRAVAKWDGTAWSDLGLVSYAGWGSVSAMTIMHDSDLIIGGSVQNIGDLTVNNVARWDGYRWHALGTGTNGYVTSLVAQGDDLYVGGEFTRAGAIAFNGFAHWSAPATEVQRIAASEVTFQAFPNPSAGSVTAMLSLPTSSRLQLNLYTPSGARVAAIDAQAAPGQQSYTFDLSGLADGPYFLELQANGVRRALQIHLFKQQQIIIQQQQ